MTGRRLFGIGVAGSLLAAVCCATPLLAIVLGALGLSAWLGWSDYIVMPALLVFLAITVYGLTRTRQPATRGCCVVPATPHERGSRDDGTPVRQDKALSRDDT
jgi:mercuric ion transport protein